MYGTNCHSCVALTTAMGTSILWRGNAFTGNNQQRFRAAASGTEVQIPSQQQQWVIDRPCPHYRGEVCSRLETQVWMQ